MVDYNGLENRRTERYRGFESLSLRKSLLKEIVNKPFAQFETVVVNDGVDFDEIDEKFGEAQTEDAQAAESYSR